MLKAGLKFAGEMAMGHALKKAAGVEQMPDDRSEEQKVFDQKMRMAQNVLGMMCPPAGRAMMILEYGPVIAAKAIQRILKGNGENS